MLLENDEDSSHTFEQKEILENQRASRAKLAEIMLVLILKADVRVDARLLESLRDACNSNSGNGLSLAELHPLIVPQYQHIMEQEEVDESVNGKHE